MTQFATEAGHAQRYGRTDALPSHRDSQFPTFSRCSAPPSERASTSRFVTEAWVTERSSERRICHSVLIGRHRPEQRCHDTRLRCPVGNEARQL